MIAFRSFLPMVRFNDGRITPFERPWLERSLARAARRAGYGDWWLAAHVTESVATYLEQDFDESIVPTARLQRAVESVLQVIGYADVAGHFQVMPPPVRISLAEIARDAGHGYELAFFDLLQSRLREALDANPPALEICDAQHGIKLLRAAKIWRRDCGGLLDEIVAFVRGELRDHDLALSMQLS